jgi:hypothetical protein
MNGAHVGVMAVDGSRHPKLIWEPSSGTGAIEYELQYATDPNFVTPTVVKTAAPTWQANADLPASVTAPVGARYYWKVRACAGTECSAFSPTWHFEIGRPLCDFNGDGFDDLAIGEPGKNSGNGRLSVFFGAAGGAFDAQPDNVVDGINNSGYFATSIACAGDVNGDGFGDLIAGAPQSIGGGTNVGYVYVLLGSPSGISDKSPYLQVFGEGMDADFFGGGVAGIGDVNGDGFADVAIGATDNTNIGLPGRAEIRLGGSGGVGVVATASLTGPQQSSFGTSIVGCDVNGDGLSDVAVGAPWASMQASIQVYNGAAGNGFTAKPDATINGPVQAAFGARLGQGDLNGDGYSDIVVGVSYGSRIEVYFGGSGALDTSADVTMAGPAGAQTGRFLAVGDINNDGFSDVVAPAYDAPGTALIYLGSAKPSDTPATQLLTILGPVGIPGDLNGDGYDDLVAASGSTVLVFFGSANGLSKSPAATINGLLINADLAIATP